MADEDDKEEDKPKGGGKKLLIMGLLLGMILGGGGAYGAIVMMGGDEKAEEVHEEVVVVEEKPKIDQQFVKVDRVTIPLIHKNRVMGYMMMDFSLEVDGNENKMAVFNHLPEIRDALLRHYSETPIGKVDSPRRIDFPKLKKTLKEICNKILHEPLVRQVLIVQAREF